MRQAVRDLVTLTFPADSAYLSVLRITVAGLGARLDLTLDEIEDLRIAVDEACAALLPSAEEGSDLRCELELESGALRVEVSVAAAAANLPAEDSFAWMVLTALAGEVSVRQDAGRVFLTLRKTSVAAADGVGR